MLSLIWHEHWLKKKHWGCVVYTIVVICSLLMMAERSYGLLNLPAPLQESSTGSSRLPFSTTESSPNERKEQQIVHAFDFTLNHEYTFTSILSGNESRLYVIHLNSSTSEIIYSLDIVLKSNNHSRNCSLWIGHQPPIPHRMFLSHLRHKHSAFRWNAPNINGASSALSTAYLLVANEDESSSSRLEFGLTVTISQFALRGGTIAFLVLFGIVVFGIVLLIIAVALVHCVSKRNENREAKEKEQQEEAHNKIEMTPIHYHKMTDEEEV